MQSLHAQECRLIISNGPEPVVWYGNMRAVEVPVNSTQLTTLAREGIRLDATNLTPSPVGTHTEFAGYERVEWPGNVGLLWEPVTSECRETPRVRHRHGCREE